MLVFVALFLFSRLLLLSSDPLIKKYPKTLNRRTRCSYGCRADPKFPGEWTCIHGARDPINFSRNFALFVRVPLSWEFLSFSLILHSQPTTLSTITFTMPNPRTFFDITIGGEPIGRIVFELVM